MSSEEMTDLPVPDAEEMGPFVSEPVATETPLKGKKGKKEKEVAEDKPKQPSNPYVMLLSFSALALLAGCVVLVMVMSRYNFEVGPGRKMIPFSWFMK